MNLTKKPGFLEKPGFCYASRKKIKISSPAFVR
jgi:hypothetical protein